MFVIVPKIGFPTVPNAVCSTVTEAMDGTVADVAVAMPPQVAHGLA